MALQHWNSTSSLIPTEDNENNASAILDSISINSMKTPESFTDSIPEKENELSHRVVFTQNNPDSDSNDDFHEDDNDVETGEVFEEIRQIYGAELGENISSYSRPVSKEIGIHDIEEIIDHLPQTTRAGKPVKSCANCYKSRRVENVSWFEKGQHIRFQGDHLTLNIGRKLVKVYHHHAIIKRVNNIFRNSVELVLIHFSKVDKTIKIIEETNAYNLKNDEIHIIEYMRPRYSREEIIRRAESMVTKQQNTEESKQFESYNLVSCNCEHFASWCVLGEGESFQAKGALKSCARIFSRISGSGCKVRRFVKQFLYNATDEIAVGFDIGKHLPIILIGSTAVIYLIHTVAMTFSYYRKHSRGKLCKACFKREVVTLWTHFGAYFTISGLSYLLVHFVSPILNGSPFGMPLLLILVFLSLYLQWGIGKVVKGLMSPYACDEIKVTHLSQITPGTMISFNYFRIPHYAIVTGKHVGNEESQIGRITCVHYGLRGFNVFGTREVLEESFEFNVKENTKNVKMIECRQLKTFPPDVIVERVRARIGEKTWSFSNRSDHLCFDTIVREDNCPCFETKVQEGSSQEKHESRPNEIAKSKSKHKSSFYVGKREIHLRNDLQTGHIVEYKGQSGIVVLLEDIEKGGEQSFKMELIVYKNYCAISKTYTVNLKKERLFIIKYHPSHCCPMNERVQRARERQGIECNFWPANGFLESCILKKL
ncbi:uncharacterized protein LOC128551063 [Mercenaria mercenaria]|uniref:uncharacterized protein LOC128551063 n=1 Tax=Mercenaria mercenaria TaxID=6596 RepID=UPI00234F1128|nr:uncharacterized protein LOC128551063 [Mercenaria mercenaria]